MTRLSSKPALLIIDMQNGFCHPKGCFAQLGIATDRQWAVISKINELRDTCRETGIPVLYTAIEFNEDYSDAPQADESIPAVRKVKGFVRGTWDSQIVNDLKPGKDEIVVSKTRNNGFWKTNLDELLAERGVDQILATGVGTNVCVESTVREARSYNYQALTVADGTATLSEEEQQASLLNLQRFGGTITVEELVKEIGARA